MKKINVFEQLSFEQLSHFIPFMHLRIYKANEVVFFRGDPSHALYLLIKGEIALTLDIKDHFEHLGFLPADKSFGDNALVPDAKRIYNAVVSSEAAHIYVIPQINIFEIFEHYPKIKAKVLESYLKQQDEYMNRLFTAYKNNLGFFELGHVYGKLI
ncbi:Crp/Fnr family transcriptional regulator [Marivirga aurantiaca]|uniref:Crp/Fnr family transcriptional regulator n=1 Tax=Marivirga aurantiaca TaxID=2802615 RepID=UPI001F41CC67|nr:cyclic nucleotide-binding domain-containing protein [Marivirga aurantiaca]